MSLCCQVVSWSRSWIASVIVLLSSSSSSTVALLHCCVPSPLHEQKRTKIWKTGDGRPAIADSARHRQRRRRRGRPFPPPHPALPAPFKHSPLLVMTGGRGRCLDAAIDGEPGDGERREEKGERERVGATDTLGPPQSLALQADRFASGGWGGCEKARRTPSWVDAGVSHPL